jgi:hypothetical protein
MLKNKLTHYAVVFLLFFTLELTAVFALELDTLSLLLQHHFQIADLHSLEAAPFTSWIYIHSQPPLFNSLVALLSYFNGKVYTDLVVLNCLCTALTALVILYISNQFAASRKWFGYVVALLYLLAPSTLLYSAYPFYPSLTSVGYAALALSFFTNKTHKIFSLILLCAAVIYLTLLRTSFPPTVALLVLGIYFFVIDNRLSSKRSVLVVTVCSLIPITAIYTKNLILYDFWGSSSFAPLNMMKGFDVPVQPNYFPTPEQIKQVHPDLQCERSYRSIDRAMFKQDGGPNYNSCYWLAFAQAHKGTAWSEYAFKPHARRVVSHIARYFSLPDKYQFVSNRTSIAQYADAFNTIFLPWPMREGYTIRMSIFFLLLLMPWLLYRYPDKRLISLCAVVVIHMTSHVLTDGDESDRFVFDIEFCFYIFLTYAAAMLVLKKQNPTADVRFN